MFSCFNCSSTRFASSISSHESATAAMVASAGSQGFEDVVDTRLSRTEKQGTDLREADYPRAESAPGNDRTGHLQTSNAISLMVR